MTSIVALIGEDNRAAPGESAHPVQPARTQPTDVRQLRGEAAILAIRRESGAAMEAADIHRELEARDWIGSGSERPYNGTTVALSRLTKKGSIDRLGRGSYQLVAAEKVIHGTQPFSEPSGTVPGADGTVPVRTAVAP